MLLGVNIDHVATLRNARGGFEPDVVSAAFVCEQAGCNSITIHLREDRRHIKDMDVYKLKKSLKTKMNLEMAATTQMQEIALEVLPQSCCIVPENRQELTTEGGLDVVNNLEKIKSFVKPLVDKGVEVSLFINADVAQIEASAGTGAQFIELHTGDYAYAFGSEEEEVELNRLKSASELAQKLGLKVNAGHGLNYDNVHRMKEVPNLYELNIGHSIISKALFNGLHKAVSEMKHLVD